MKLALSIYALVYAVATALAIMDDFRSKKSLVDKLCDSLLMPLGLVGTMLFAYPGHGVQVKLLWRFMAPLIVVGLVICNVVGRYSTIARSEATQEAIVFGDVVTMALLLPMFATNLIFAYS